MYCTRCGKPLPDAAQFCSSCGSKVSAPVAETPVVETPVVEVPVIEAAPTPETPAYETPAVEAPVAEAPVVEPAPTPAYAVSVPAAEPTATTGGSPARAALKSVASSPLLLIAAIAFTLSLLLPILSYILPFGGSASWMSALYDLAYELDLEDVFFELYDLFDADGFGVVSAFLVQLPNLLIAIGLWVTYLSGVSRKSPCPTTAGLSMIKAMIVLGLVRFCLVCSLVLIVVLGVAVAGSYLLSSDAVFILFPLAVAVTVLGIIYYAKVIRSINAAKNTAKTGRPFAGASRFVAVACFAMAFFSFFGVFGLFTYGFMPSPYRLIHMLTNGLSVVCSVAAPACFGILIFKYRSKMSSR